MRHELKLGTATGTLLSTLPHIGADELRGERPAALAPQTLKKPLPFRGRRLFLVGELHYHSISAL